MTTLMSIVDESDDNVEYDYSNEDSSDTEADPYVDEGLDSNIEPNIEEANFEEQ